LFVMLGMSLRVFGLEKVVSFSGDLYYSYEVLARLASVINSIRVLAVAVSNL
jgi:hypothetical protein